MSKKSGGTSRRRPSEEATPARSRSRLRGRGLVFAGAVLATLVAGGLYWTVQQRHQLPQRVILISIDTLRADHLSSYGYERLRTPHIDALADDGVLFESAATATPLTLPAHASVFTGRTPFRHGVTDNYGSHLAEEETTLAEILRARGFATGGFVGAFVLDSQWGVAQGFDTYFDHFEPSQGAATLLDSAERPGNEVLEPTLAWIREHREGPFFCFIHFFDPHTPYLPPEPYRSESGADPRRLYDGEIAFVDDLVGRLISELRTLGLYEDALIVFFGDHGESLGDHGEVTHGFFLYDATVRVPLIVKAPGMPVGGRVSAQVRTIDVTPTILDLLGIDPRESLQEPGSLDGVSLRPLLRNPSTDLGLTAFLESRYAHTYFGWAPLTGLRNERYKFIEAPRRELYDLRDDAGESRNLAEERPGVVAQLAQSLEALARVPRAPSAAPLVADPATEERLRSLGYLTARVPAASAEEPAALADPKDKIGILNRVSEARDALRTGGMERAAELLSAVLEEDPDVILARFLLGNLHLRRNEFAEAEAAFQRVLSRDETNFEAAYGLALAHKGQGRIEDAAVGFERCLALHPESVGSAYQLAEIRLAQGRAEEAERVARRALGRSPDISLRLSLADALVAQGKRAAARAVLEEAEEPPSALVAMSLGNLLLEEGDLEGAEAQYRKAVRTDPESARAYNSLGNVAVRKGDEESSYRMFGRAVELDGSFAPAQNNFGIALARRGELRRAEEAFRKAIEADPSYAEAYNNLGFLYLRAGSAREAVPFFRKALSLRPDYAQARANLEAALAALSSS